MYVCMYLCMFNRYSKSLASRVDAKVCIIAGSEEEVQIRAATIQVVERMKDEINKYYRKELCKDAPTSYVHTYIHTYTNNAQ